MDDEWDLYAVVRSCTTNSTDAATSGNVTVDDYEDGYDYNMETVADMINPYSYSNSGDNPSEGLEEVYKEGCSQRLPTTTTTTITTTTTTTGGFFDEQEQPSVSFDASDHSLSNESPSKKRKNQQKKMVVELTQEELCNDTWAWRKYGQKPIKGSPFPRNYYKCSTTKACGARKQVEQSHMDPTVFIVSYSGEHIHPRPTHRSPLAGSTRSNKFTPPPPDLDAAGGGDGGL
ncbi:probable WRKY transcription factor 27 [Cynara cardunculus var. scolymus]|uniref:probable WRKY transcription factor 27 n=1 Tax=Cynara cardunculus var. scolymus TaxID=59895 RepID=UPI000D627DA4|nr:probable WRKY transcription factor 27 [Cynara cardunculus var. scolymus]